MNEARAQKSATKAALKEPSEVESKSVGEIVLSWNAELECRTVCIQHIRLETFLIRNTFTLFFSQGLLAARARGFLEWDGHILKNRQKFAALQVDLGKVSSSQDKMDRHLHILQVHQKGICETLSVMESEAELLTRLPDEHKGARSQVSPRSQELLHAVSESVSAQICDLGDLLHEIVFSDDSVQGTLLIYGALADLRAHLQSLQSIEQKIRKATRVV